ncbi:MAG: PQQ-binding-like beta-propeller repeat protein, partial [Planctomycetota bacterium]
MIRLLKFTAIGALLPILASPQGHGQEWPRFRGPNGQGQGAAPAIPAQWTDDDYCWVADLPGIGNSSPVLWGNRIFLQSADPNTGAQYVFCIDATIGKIIWQREFASSTYPIHGRNSFASASPAADERRVYVAWATPEQLTLGALDHHGKVEWMRKDLGPYASQHGFGVSPMLVGDLVILCNQQSPPETGSDQTSSIMAFDQRTGDLRWETPRRSDKVSYSVPCLHTRPDGTIELIGCSTADGFYSLDPETGRENWTAEAFTMRTVSSPVLLENLLLGTTGSG